MQQADSKDSLRRAIVLRRSALSEAEWVAEDASRTRHLLRLLGPTPGTLALYASRPGEPDTHDAISLLHDAGWQVLLPTVSKELGWAAFSGWHAMTAGWQGIPEPMSPRLGARELSLADVVVVACLAVARDGTRLGTGGGWYDRALPHRRPGTPVWALARAGELLDTLPVEAHDVAVDSVITPAGIHSCGASATGCIGQPWRAQLS